jgi:hypothetical protein
MASPRDVGRAEHFLAGDVAPHCRHTVRYGQFEHGMIQFNHYERNRAGT